MTRMARAAAANLRSPELGRIPGLAEAAPPSSSLSMFQQTCVNRQFELKVAEVYGTGIIKMPIYLSVGSEHVPVAIAAVSRDLIIFAQHRAHSYYLSFGGNVGRLIDELLHRETGCAGGMGGSASIHDPSIRLYGHSGLMGDQVPIAVGAALGSGRPALAVMGDASAEEDYVYGAMGFAATKRAPVLFLCEDNDLSILTHVAVRRSWSIVDVAASLGMPAWDIADDPWLIAHTAAQALTQLPAFINIRTCRHLWHAGTGTDGPPEWNRFELFKAELERLGHQEAIREIEREAAEVVERAWRERLPKS